jgi:hypothetical protein
MLIVRRISMSVSYAFAIVLLVVSAILMSSAQTRNKVNYDLSTIDKKSTDFLIYANSLDSYIKANPSYSGDVSSLITLPTWIGKDTNIKTYAANGRGYVYVANMPGLLSTISKMTNESSQLGITNSSQIVTNGGSITKPSYIPINNVVYVR